jgi:hypothetical protein
MGEILLAPAGVFAADFTAGGDTVHFSSPLDG